MNLRIRTHINLLAALAILIMAFMVLLMTFNNRTATTQINNYELVHPLLKHTYQLNNLTQNYLNRPRARFVRQWDKTYNGLIDTSIPNLYPLLDAATAEQEQKRLISQLEQINQVFQELVANSKLEQEEEPGNFKIYRVRLGDTIQLRLTRLTEEVHQLLDKTISSSFAKMNDGYTILLSTMVGAILLFFALANLLYRRIARPLYSLTQQMDKTSTEINAASNEHIKILEQQISAINQTGVSLQELNASANNTSERAIQSANESQEAAQMATHAKEAIGEMRGAMVQLKQKIEQISHQVSHLTDQIAQIQDITETVTDLAGQTNMLALNAAVEASRAGEHGKGFSVVSGEIRKLAHQSKEEAQRIRNMISGILSVTTETAHSSFEGGQVLTESSKIIEQSGEQFLLVTNAVEGLADSMEVITLTSKQQAKAISQVVAAAKDIEAGGRQSSISVQQTKRAIDEIIEVSDQLAKMI